MNHIEYKEKLGKALIDVNAEVIRAKSMFPDNFVNQHEAYAVLLEEVDELWDEIKKNQRNYNLFSQRKEAIQAAAMLMRFVVELMPEQSQQEEIFGWVTDEEIQNYIDSATYAHDKTINDAIRHHKRKACEWMRAELTTIRSIK